MTSVDHRCTRKSVMEVSKMTSLCMCTKDVPLELQSRCVGNHQGDGYRCYHGLGFKILQGKFKDHNRNQDHGKVK